MNYYEYDSRYLFSDFSRAPVYRPLPFGSGFIGPYNPNPFSFNMMKMTQIPIPNIHPNMFYPKLNQYPIFSQNQYPMFNSFPLGQSIFSQFKTKDGKIDFNKILNTSGQMIGAFNQIQSIVKGISQTFKGV